MPNYTGMDFHQDTTTHYTSTIYWWNRTSTTERSGS
jgi:hypothetical protein